MCSFPAHPRSICGVDALWEAGGKPRCWWHSPQCMHPPIADLRPTPDGPGRAWYSAALIAWDPFPSVEKVKLHPEIIRALAAAVEEREKAREEAS